MSTVTSKTTRPLRIPTVYKAYSDPGHGWIAVPQRVLVALGIDQSISPYSYMRGYMAYLEEDCDLSVFMNAYRRAMGRDPSLRCTTAAHRQSRIRGYAPYRAPQVSQM
jgi:hypothetical protein